MKGEDEPKDLGLKLGTKELIVWEAVLLTAKNSLKSYQDEIIVQTEIKKLAERKIEEENAKFK